MWATVLPILGAATIVALVGIFIAGLFGRRRRRCPACGKRGFVPILSAGMDDGDGSYPEYHILECRSCSLRQVECVRGVRTLPADGWKKAAEQYARND